MYKDKIFIEDLLLRCVIGINDWERKVKQDVLISIELFLSLEKAGKTDSLEDSIDYKKLNKKIIQMVEGSQFYLIEALAEEIAKICLEEEKVKAVRVILRKPHALRFAKNVGVEIYREKS